MLLKPFNDVVGFADISALARGMGTKDEEYGVAPGE